MLTWFKRQLWKWAEDGKYSIEAQYSDSYYSDDIDTPRSDPAMSFKIYNAVGGKIVEFRMIDKQSDEYISKLYIIHDEEDFGDSIKKIAMLNALSQ